MRLVTNMDDETAWRAGMMSWVEEYGKAIDAVRADVLAAKAAQSDGANLAQQAFVPMGGVALQESAHALRGQVSLRSIWLAAWQSSGAATRFDASRHEVGAIESFADSFFTLCTLDNETYCALSDTALQLANAPWLMVDPSPKITHAAVVHRGPANGGHVKLYLRGGGADVFALDFTKAASKLKGYDWGAAAPLSCAGYAYPRSGEMYPTIYRFLPSDGEKVPEYVPVPESDEGADEAQQGRWSSAQSCGRIHRDVVAGSGWFPLHGAWTVRTAYSTFIALALRRWAHVELYNCRSFVQEMLLKLDMDAASVREMLTRTFCAVAQMQDPDGPAAAGNPWANAWFR